MAMFVTKTSNTKEYSEWHVGEPLPWHILRNRIITFQADGDELELIIRAMEQTRMKPKE